MTADPDGARLKRPPKTLIFASPPVAFTREQFALIRKGYQANAMEEKWNLTFVGGRLLISRSWTGHVVYECTFEETPSGAHFKEIIVAGDIPVDHELGFVAEAWYLVTRWILNEPVDFKWVGDYRREIYAAMRRRLTPPLAGLPDLPDGDEARLDHLLDLARRQPPTSGLEVSIAAALTRLGRDFEAEAALGRAIALDPEPRHTLLKRASARRRLRLLGEAVADIEAALRLALAEGLGPFRSIVSDFDRLSRDERDRDLRELFASGFLTCFDLFLDTDSMRLKEGLLTRGGLNLIVKDWHGAVAGLSSYLLEKNDDAFARTYRGFAFLKLGELDRAAADFKGVGMHMALAWMGEVLYRAGDAAGADALLRKSLILDSDNAFALALRARCRAELGRDLAAAREDLERALAREPVLEPEAADIRRLLDAAGADERQP